jgi:hypothetical protein
MSTPISPRSSEEEDLQVELESKVHQMIFLKKKLNHDVGYNYWKKYVASAFWCQVSTPVNLVITFLTAITTAQAQSDQLIPQHIYASLTVASLIITTLNTFFRPHAQYATNAEFVAKWHDIGIRFEKEWYDKVLAKIDKKQQIQVIDKKIESYKSLQNEIVALRKAEGTTTINFLTDLIFIICYSTCIRNYKRWLDFDKKIEQETEEKDTKESALRTLNIAKRMFHNRPRIPTPTTPPSPPCPPSPPPPTHTVPPPLTSVLVLPESKDEV